MFVRLSHTHSGEGDIVIGHIIPATMGRKGLYPDLHGAAAEAEMAVLARFLVAGNLMELLECASDIGPIVRYGKYRTVESLLGDAGEHDRAPQSDYAVWKATRAAVARYGEGWLPGKASCKKIAAEWMLTPERLESASEMYPDGLVAETRLDDYLALQAFFQIAMKLACALAGVGDAAGESIVESAGLSPSSDGGYKLSVPNWASHIIGPVFGEGAASVPYPDGDPRSRLVVSGPGPHGAGIALPDAGSWEECAYLLLNSANMTMSEKCRHSPLTSPNGNGTFEFGADHEERTGQWWSLIWRKLQADCAKAWRAGICDACGRVYLDHAGKSTTHFCSESCRQRKWYADKKSEKAPAGSPQ